MTTVQVTGNKDWRAGFNVRGEYKLYGEKNGRPIYKRVSGRDMFIYWFSDTRKWGWYIGWDTNGHYSAFNESDSETPPEAGWSNLNGNAPKLRVRITE